LRNLKPQVEELTVNARRAPKRILDAHLPDERTQLFLKLRPVISNRQ
jgi:hypothetical protein